MAILLSFADTLGQLVVVREIVRQRAVLVFLSANRDLVGVFVIFFERISVVENLVAVEEVLLSMISCVSPFLNCMYFHLPCRWS